MKYLSLSLILTALLAFTPVFAQSSRTNRAARGAAAAAAAQEEPNTGVRFVICAPNGGSLPNPLYYQSGEEFKRVRISSRVPSQRIRPIGGEIKFYDKDPAAEAAQDQGDTPAARPARTARPARRGQQAAAALPEPYLTVNVPQTAGSKSICIVIPTDNPRAPQTFFLNEAQFPAKGVHVINLSPRPLIVQTSTSGNFSDIQNAPIGVFKRNEGVTESNSWHYTSGNHGDQVSFRLCTRQNRQSNGRNSATLVPFKSGKFIVSERQSQINVVVESGNTLKLISIQAAN